MALPNLRRLFSSFRTEEEERDFSRTAFFNLVGFLATSALFSIIAQKANDKCCGPRVFSRGLILNNLAGSDPYEDGLAKLRLAARDTLSVTEYMTQYDELRQIHKFAGAAVKQTEQMTEGTRIHAALESSTPLEEGAAVGFPELLASDLPVNVLKYLELEAKLYELATSPTGTVREMRMRAYAPNGCLLRGIIDKLEVCDDGLVVTETKTTRHRELFSYQVRLAYHQALMYRWMLKQFLDTSSGALHRSLFQLTDNEKKVLDDLPPQILAATSTSVSRLADVGVAPYVKLQFLKRGPSTSVFEEETLVADYDEGVLQDVLRSRIDLFEGRREPIAGTLREADNELFVSDSAR